jgi:hypothetical protein
VIPEASFDQNLTVTDFVVGPHSVAHGEICGVLIERLEDVSRRCFVFLCNYLVSMTVISVFI